MGRKGNWFSAVKKALNPESKEKSKQESGKSKKKWYKKKKRSESKKTPVETAPVAPTLPPPPVVPPVPLVAATIEPAKLSEVEKEQTKHAYTIALATAKAAEAAVAAAQAAAEVVRLTATANQFTDKSKEEVAAIKIQKIFRGYMARRTLRALRGLMRLKTMMQGQAVKRQTTSTLKSMQTLARVQGQIRERRLKMAEENLARQRQMQQKHAKEQAKAYDKSQKNGDGWDNTGRTKEQIEAKMLSKHEAAIRRERTLAYAFTHQTPWKASSRSATTLFMDPTYPHWGWSWLERWLAARPWETATIPEKDYSNDNSPRYFKATSKSILPGSQMSKKSYHRHHNASEKPSPTSPARQTRPSSAGRLSTSSAPSRTVRKMRTPSPRASPRASLWGQDDDARSMASMRSDQSRRNSVTGSSLRDDESLASSQTVPSYMAPTEAAKARSRLAGESRIDRRSVTPDRTSVSSARKRHSYTPSPARSRRSTSSVADINSLSEQT